MKSIKSLLVIVFSIILTKNIQKVIISCLENTKIMQIEHNINQKTTVLICKASRRQFKLTMRQFKFVTPLFTREDDLGHLLLLIISIVVVVSNFLRFSKPPIESESEYFTV